MTLPSTIVFLFSLVNMADLAFEKIFQAIGRMNVTMVALMFGCVSNIILDPILIFSLGPDARHGHCWRSPCHRHRPGYLPCGLSLVYARTEVSVRFCAAAACASMLLLTASSMPSVYRPS